MAFDAISFSEETKYRFEILRDQISHLADEIGELKASQEHFENRIKLEMQTNRLSLNLDGKESNEHRVNLMDRIDILDAQGKSHSKNISNIYLNIILLGVSVIFILFGKYVA